MRNIWPLISCLIVLPAVLFVGISNQKFWQSRTFSVNVSNTSLRFTSDGKQLIIKRRGSGGDGELRDFQFWDVASGTRQRTLPLETRPYVQSALSPDAKVVASAEWSGNVKLWDVETGQEIRTLQRPKAYGTITNAIAFSPDGEVLAQSFGYDGNNDPEADRKRPNPHAILLWDVKTGALRRLLKSGERSAIYFSPNSKLLVGYEIYSAEVWNAEKGQLMYDLKGVPEYLAPPQMAISGDGKTLAYIDAFDADAIRLCDIKTGKLKVKVGGGKGPMSALTFAPDGKTLAGLSNFTEPPPLPKAARALRSTGKIEPNRGELRLWDSRTGRLIKSFKKDNMPLFSVAFSVDGQMVAAGSNRQTLLWKTANGKLLRTLNGHSKNVNVLAFSPDNSNLATGSEDKTVMLWRIK